ncbi:hypothetical protein SCODD09_00754 [Streptococcus constellatus]|nr:hypothetical protein SCODD09_00754 [Streptococcus constellatus]
MFSFFTRINPELQKIKRSKKEMELRHKKLAEKVCGNIQKSEEELIANRAHFQRQSNRVRARMKSFAIQNKER